MTVCCRVTSRSGYTGLSDIYSAARAALNTRAIVLNLFLVLLCWIGVIDKFEDRGVAFAWIGDQSSWQIIYSLLFCLLQ